MSQSTRNTFEMEKSKDGWITCKSKRYGGQNYYFNIITGKAVWNLSESEIEKAKKATDGLYKQENYFTHNCPEPLESPCEYENRNYNNETRNLNNEINQKITRIVTGVCNNSVGNGQLVQTSHNHYAPLNTLPIGIPLPPLYNSMFCSLPGYQLPVDNNTLYIPGTGTSLSLSSRFKSLQESNRFSNNIQNKRDIKYLKNGVNFSTTTFVKDYNNTATGDLRELLQRKQNIRQLKNNDVNINLETHKNVSSCDTSYEKTNNLLPSSEKMDMGTWQPSEYSKVLDISLLRDYLNIEDNSKNLYIVTDANVILNKINILQQMLLSDKRCILIVPRVVMNQIRRARDFKHPNAHSAGNFILLQCELGQAAIDEDKLGDNTTTQDEIINCCLGISEEKLHVVLLTDDDELLSGKKTVEFTILSLIEVKKILDKYPLRKQDKSIKRAYSNEEEKQLAPYVNVKTNGSDHEPTVSKKPFNEPIIKINSRQEILKRSDSIPKENGDVPAAPSTSTATTINDRKEDTENNLNNEGPKTRIKLKRHRTYTSSASNNLSTDTRNFRWRRKKSLCGELNATNANTESENTNSEPNFNPQSSELPNVPTETNANSGRVDRVSTEVTENVSNNKPSNIEEAVSNDKRVSGNADNHVMFEVVDSTMEDHLKMKCDEWSSRFTQIMEEVLSQVLRQEPAFATSMPPPWTLYEATKCIKRKFRNDCDVLDAANKLCDTLFDVGALRGKIKNDITPHQYMEMYSYGVYLTDALQGVLNDCEDLQIAAESLSKLLIDIQNIDFRSQDSFLDVTMDTEHNGIVEMSRVETTREENVKPTETAHIQLVEKAPSKCTEIPQLKTPKMSAESSQRENVEETTGEKYAERPKTKNVATNTTIGKLERSATDKKTRSSKKRPKSAKKSPRSPKRKRNVSPEKTLLTEETVEVAQDQINTTTDEGANTNCQITKEISKSSPDIIDNSAQKKPKEDKKISSPSSQKYNLRSSRNTSPQKKEVHEKSSFLSNFELEKNSNVEAPVTNIVRTDDSGPHVEERGDGPETNAEETLQDNEQTNANQQTEPNGNTETSCVRKFVPLQDFEDRIKNNQRDSPDPYEEQDFYDNCEYGEDVTADEQYDDQDDYHLYEDGCDYYDGEEYGKLDRQLNCFMEAVVNKTRRSLRLIHVFCMKTLDALKSSHEVPEKCKLQAEADQTLVAIDDICRSLEDILKREELDEKHCIPENSKSEEQTESYRNVLQKYVEQGNILKESVKLILELIKY